MKYLLSFHFFIFLFLLVNSNTSAQIDVQANRITISNEVLQKEWEVSSSRPGKIRIHAIINKKNNDQLINNQSTDPWFEFVINHQLITSNDPVWQYMNYSERQLANHGKEYILNFQGKVHPVKGLMVSLKEQIFPGSRLVREQLILHTSGKYQFSLNKEKGQLHFVFPRYNYQQKADSGQSVEIRLATWDGEVLDSINNTSYDFRKIDNERYGGDHDLSQGHMFHPKKVIRPIENDTPVCFKGPLGYLKGKEYTFFTAYEHASQDNRVIPQPYDNLEFLNIEQKIKSGDMSSAVTEVKGGYLDGEMITAEKPYASVWTANGFFKNTEKGQPEKQLHDYLLKWITEYPQSRQPKFCYNTWAMQVDERSHGKKATDVINYPRLYKEIRSAHEMGMNVFVLDAGWEEGAGIWQPSSKRLKKGFSPLLDTLHKYNMKLGVWMSPLIISPQSERYKQHPEWLIKDKDGKPVMLGGASVIDFVSGYCDLFINDCKKLIDQGVRYFKWDAIGTYYSACTGAQHGTSQDPEADVIARYGYLLPLYIKKAMSALMQYNSDVIIEIDLTENKRALMGLSTISAGKLFFINNGASDYGDYSQYRAKTSRLVVNEYNGIIPLPLFTYYNYPQNSYPFLSQRYNVNSSLIGGWGLWGNLGLMKETQKKRVYEFWIKNAERIQPFIAETPTAIIGKVGASPEIYTTVNTNESAGQVIAFSGSPLNYVHHVLLNKEFFLAVLNNAFKLNGDTLDLTFQFPASDDSREAFILPNKGSGIHILSFTGWLKEILLNKKQLTVHAGSAGDMVLQWPVNMGYPNIEPLGNIQPVIIRSENYYIIKLQISKEDTDILIK